MLWGVTVNASLAHLLRFVQITDDGHKGGKDGQAEADSQNQCYYCNQVFQNANTLRRHCRQAHGKDRCHVCGLCNKAFKRATHLKVRTCVRTADCDAVDCIRLMVKLFQLITYSKEQCVGLRGIHGWGFGELQGRGKKCKMFVHSGLL